MLSTAAAAAPALALLGRAALRTFALGQGGGRQQRRRRAVFVVGGGQQLTHGGFILAHGDQGVDDGLAALGGGQRFCKEPLGDTEPPGGPDGLVRGAEAHDWRLEWVPVPFGETDFQLVLRGGVAAEARLARAVGVRGTGPRPVLRRGLVLELALVSVPAALPLQVELANPAIVGGLLAAPTPGRPASAGHAAREQGQVQGHRPDGVGDALAEAIPVDGGQRHGFLLPLGETLVQRHRLQAVRRDGFLAVALAEDLLEELLQGGPKVPAAHLQSLPGTLPVKPVPVQDQTNTHTHIQLIEQNF